MQNISRSIHSDAGIYESMRAFANILIFSHFTQSFELPILSYDYSYTLHPSCVTMSKMYRMFQNSVMCVRVLTAFYTNELKIAIRFVNINNNSLRASLQRIVSNKCNLLTGQKSHQDFLTIKQNSSYAENISPLSHIRITFGNSAETFLRFRQLFEHFECRSNY